MREANTYDLSLLVLLAIIWGSSFFNIKIATYSYDPITLALVRVFFASIPLLFLCKIKNIKISAFSKNWNWYALIGLCNIAIPFVLITLAPRYITAAEVNLFFLLETVLGPFWVWLVIKEQPSIETIIGGAVIILTIATHSFLALKKT